MNSVTNEQIESLIVHESYYTPFDGVQGASAAGTYVGKMHGKVSSLELRALHKVTHCTLILKGGYAVTGTNMGPVLGDSNSEFGRKDARAKAIDQIWPLLGYQLHLQQGGDWMFRLENEAAELKYKNTKLHEAWPNLSADLREKLAKQLDLQDELLVELEKRL